MTNSIFNNYIKTNNRVNLAKYLKEKSENANIYEIPDINDLSKDTFCSDNHDEHDNRIFNDEEIHTLFEKVVIFDDHIDWYLKYPIDKEIEKIEYYSQVEVTDEDGFKTILDISPRFGVTADFVEGYIDSFFANTVGTIPKYDWKPLSVDTIDEEFYEGQKLDTPSYQDLNLIQFSKIRVYNEELFDGFVMEVPKQFLCKGLPYPKYIDKWYQLTSFMKEHFPDLNWTPIDDESNED